MILRTLPSCGSSYEVKLPSDVSRLAEELHGALCEDGHGDAYINKAVHELIGSIILREWESNNGDFIADPVMRSVVL